ncbi:MAG: DUF6428 family protein [Rhodospirillales bacterium]
MNLLELRSRLNTPDAAELIFSTEQGPIGQGYHLTEIKHATVTGIDCGARVTTWTEASLQLLDGAGDAYMTVGKFKGILDTSLATIEDLGDAGLKVEFANGNAGLRLYRITHIAHQDRRVVITLGDDRAVCKPAAERSTPPPNEGTGCCSAPRPAGSCCA